MPNQTMVYSCSAPEQEYTMVWFGIFLYLLISSLKIRFCEQSVFAKSPLFQVYSWVSVDKQKYRYIVRNSQLYILTHKSMIWIWYI